MTLLRLLRQKSLVLSTVIVALPTLALLVTLQACTTDSADNDATGEEEVYGYGYGYGYGKGKKAGNPE